MHRFTRLALLSAAAAAVLGACASVESASAPAADTTPAAIEASAIEAHVRFLADDVMEGREAGTRGYDLAANYVESQFRLMGLEPGGEDGTYRQAVPLITMTPVREAASMSLNGEPLTNGEDFLIAAHPILDESATEGEAVFVGFGVDAPGLGHDDYAGLDVEGKIVVMLSGAPQGLPSDVAAHLGSTGTKQRIAAERGASGAILLPLEGLSRFTFDQYAQFAAGRPQTTVAAAFAGESLRVTGVASDDVARRLFEGGELALEDIVAAARSGEPIPGFELGDTISMAQATQKEIVESDNVIGILPGADPERGGEVVVVTAHLDHIGVCRLEEAEDRICNGVMDNASGSAIMMETARALAHGEASARSIAFVALTAEEKGLLGAAHLAANPTPPLAEMVANVNLDMPILTYEFNDLTGFGAEHSTIGPIARAAGEREGVAISADPIPEQALFVRSDHYRFVLEGVPSLFLMTGFSSPDPDDDEGAAFLAFLGGPYHAPNDDLAQEILWDQGAKFACVNRAVIEAIADAPERPRWNEDSYFRSLARE